MLLQMITTMEKARSNSKADGHRCLGYSHMFQFESHHASRQKPTRPEWNAAEEKKQRDGH
jgi:hypothetical protein